MKRTAQKVGFLCEELKRHPAMAGLMKIKPAVEELSHDWHDACHFTACDERSGQDVVIKVGAAPAESYWTAELARVAPDIVPIIFAVGEITGPQEESVQFIATEKLAYSLIGDHWEGRQADLLLEAVAQFQAACRAIEPRHIVKLTLPEVLGWLEEGSGRNPPGNWPKVVEKAPRDYAWLEDCWPFEVCHGDLHVGNAFSRRPPPDGPAVLIDINPILQPWVFDATWVEACGWRDLGRRGMLATVRQLAERRRAIGLKVPSDEVVERAGRIALSWHAIRLWDPDHLEFMPGFKEATEAFINSGASVER